jgi:hypothetical protein
MRIGRPKFAIEGLGGSSQCVAEVEDDADAEDVGNNLNRRHRPRFPKRM